MAMSKKQFVVVQLVILIAAMVALILYSRHSSVSNFIYAKF